MAKLFEPVRALFRATLPLSLCPVDTEVGTAEKKSISDLAASFSGKACLIVGGTRGIGKATAEVLSQAGAKVTVVGRSATGPGRAASPPMPPWRHFRARAVLLNFPNAHHAAVTWLAAGIVLYEAAFK